MERKLSVVFLFLYALFFSVAKTLRLPNDWAKAHWLMDYHFGFIKRGLGGEVLGLFFEKTELNIVVLSVVILLTLYFLLLKTAFQTTVKEVNNLKKVLFYQVFFLSQYIVFTAHLIGYLDHLIFLFTFLTIFLILKNKIFYASIIAGVSVLFHEISFFLLIPVSIFAIMVSKNKILDFKYQSLFETSFLTKFFMFLIFPIFVLGSLFYFQDLNSVFTHSAVFNYLKGFKFIKEIPADSVSSGFTKSFAYQWKAQSPHFFQRVFVSTCTVFYGIPMLFMFLMILKYFDFKRNFYLIAIIGFISLCPLFLHAIAYDTYRIWSFPFLIMFLIFMILNLCKFPLNKNSSLHIFDWFLFVISFLLVTFIPNHLFDGEAERFSLLLRVFLSVPIVLMLIFYIKKSQIKKTETL
ncbi:hypothetical protein [Chryseobacterium sp.]|uniref:hypothetical protein n=1 Tax=Chryseobacterium sp. TaxID=1871047 RepID=UPI00289ECDB9|nr:hypothetical protein [Chryseobacterium sp.]